MRERETRKGGEGVTRRKPALLPSPCSGQALVSPSPCPPVSVLHRCGQRFPDRLVMRLRASVLPVPSAAEGSPVEGPPMRYCLLRFSTRMATSVIDASSRGLPFFSRDAGLPQKPSQQVYANISSMRVGQNQPAVPSEHKLVPTSCVGAFKPQPFQTPNQFTT